ncbi:hypothetical protein B0H13DRAFT_2474694, partial [Mycena leptocephala]
REEYSLNFIDGSIACSCTAGDRFAKLIDFFNDAGFVFHTPTSCLNIFLVTASVRHKHRCPLLDAHPHPSSAAQPGASTSASMLQTRALPRRASSPSLSPSFPPPSVSTRSHPLRYRNRVDLYSSASRVPSSNSRPRLWIIRCPPRISACSPVAQRLAPG